ncbi:mRNA-decapping enzyme-like protein [Sphaceloma murrayae]|uniref:mRNA-decapping enzyme-like protein n=1 Tax=Sphaceloma murrayae TaxID=2082308 RepID=A0A2K1QFH5_9PEZI|nr:mRNA-decapping enzyme-like protein [Sphaceloma murrayae]
MSAFFGARAPELTPENVQDLNVKPAQHRKMPLHERSLSDLNKSNNGKPKPTIRLVDSDHDSSSIYSKSPFPSKPSQILEPSNENTRKLKDPVYIDVPAANARPSSREGATSRSHHYRRPNRTSVSTTASTADTLVADSLFSPTSRRFSVESVVKSPHPVYTIEGHGDHLEPLEEQSSDPAELQTSDLPDIPELPSSVPDRPRHMAHSSSVYSSVALDELSSETPRRNRPRSSSSGLGFCVSPISENENELDSYMGPKEQASQDSMAESARSGSSQERGTPHIIRYVSSNDSLQPQYASLRPAPYHSASASSLWSSDSIGEADVPPLQIPRKRAHMHSASLNSYPSMTRIGASHLSTIASETEFPESSRVSQQQSPQMTGSWPRRRRTITSSAYSESVASPKIVQSVKASSSYDTMSSGIHSESAVPQPLFSSSAPIPQHPFNRMSSGQHTSEIDDTIGELQAPPLREKRSGYFVRKRSQSDLRPSSRQSNHTNQSAVETERWSTGSFIFPQWAKYFYGAGMPMLSAKPSMQTLAAKPSLQTLGGPMYASANGSRITIAGPPYASIDGNISRSFDFSRPLTQPGHSRNSTVFTFMTRPESSHSNWETIPDESPASRLTSIFRRPRSMTDGPNNTRDSLSIFSEPPVHPTAPPAPQHKQPSLRSSLRSSLRHPLRQNPPKGKTPRKSSGRPSVNAHGHETRSSPLAGTPAYASFPTLIPNGRLMRSLTAWRVPSIDEPFPREILGRGNRQIVCFCLGFLLPPLWMLAAVLPLPKCGWRDEREEEWGVNEVIRDEKGNEIVVEQGWSWEDERRYLKANWWRNLNRVMSVVGVGILGAIIALAVLASRG